MSVVRKLAVKMLEGGYDSSGVGGKKPVTHGEQALLEKENWGGSPQVSVERNLYKYMSASRPGELEGVKVFGSRFSKKELRDRIKGNLRTTGVEKFILHGL